MDPHEGREGEGEESNEDEGQVVGEQKELGTEHLLGEVCIALTSSQLLPRRCLYEQAMPNQGNEEELEGEDEDFQGDEEEEEADDFELDDEEEDDDDDDNDDEEDGGDVAPASKRQRTEGEGGDEE